MKNILIIGGNKGLGKVIADKLITDGNNVICLSRNSSIPLDLLWDEERIKAQVKAAIPNGLDTLIVSSGEGAYLHPLTSQNKVEELMKINFIGPTTVFKACVKPLLKSRGKAIFITSTAGRKPGSGGLSYYGASKMAMNSWVMSESRRFAKHGVALCTVAPSWFDSGMTSDIKPGLKNASTRAIPFGRFGNIDEISNFVVNLMNQSNWCLAGTTFEVTGGL